jgi:1-acyl-sn-glycerol-3-phosphate acyltransferase
VRRAFLKAITWVLVRVLLRIRQEGREYYPTNGPLLLVSNHLGDADGIIGLAIAKVPFDVMGKIELYDIPVIGKLLEWYGTIWVHRGRPDRRALRAALDGLAEGRMIAIAPEGRESLTGGLENGTNGAAYIALKADVPILPVVVTGTENWRIYGNLKKFRRTSITVKAGPPFRLTNTGNRKKDIRKGTQTIMKTLAWMLPFEYQGIYRDVIKEDHDSK